MYGMGIKKSSAKIDELLKFLELEKHKHKLVTKISGGMQRRLDFAISLLHDPEILILDEPTTGLDPIMRESVFKLMVDIRDKNKTIILISHHLDFIQRYCDNVAVLDKGSIIEFFEAKSIPKKYSKKQNLIEAFETILK